jgi:DNA-binding GntR family transcriptional regulator
VTETRTGVTPIHQEVQSLVDRVTHAVRQSIVDGRLRPGETLSISDLASDLRTSHSPVREALQRLASQGLVELRPARTAIVAPLGLDDLHEIYRLRLLNEVDAVGRACPLLTETDLAEIEEQFRLLDSAARDSEEFWTSHDAFHRLLMRPVATPRLDRLTNQLWQAAERYIRVVYGETDVLEHYSAYERHIPLLEAARGGDDPTMRMALTAHLSSNERELSTKLAAILGAEPT